MLICTLQPTSNALSVVVTWRNVVWQIVWASKEIRAKSARHRFSFWDKNVSNLFSFFASTDFKTLEPILQRIHPTTDDGSAAAATNPISSRDLQLFELNFGLFFLKRKMVLMYYRRLSQLDNKWLCLISEAWGFENFTAFGFSEAFSPRLKTQSSSFILYTEFQEREGQIMCKDKKINFKNVWTAKMFWDNILFCQTNGIFRRLTSKLPRFTV